MPYLSSKISCYIINIDLLHWFKEENQFDRMQWEVCQSVFMDLDVMQIFENDEDDNDALNKSVLLSLMDIVTDALALSFQFIDFYIYEIIDIIHDSGFFDAQMSEIISDIFPILSKINIAHAFKFLNAADLLFSSLLYNYNLSSLLLLIIFIFDSNSMTEEALFIINVFILNVE